MKTFNKAAIAVAVASSSVGANAGVVEDLTAAIATLQTETLVIIGLAATAGVAIMTVSLGWDVGFNLVRKFVKKGAK